MITENIMDFDKEANKLVLTTFEYRTQKERSAALREKEKELGSASPIFPKSKDAKLEDTPSFNKELAEEYINKLNEEIANGTAVVKECKTCKKIFVLSEAEVAWYEERKFKLPEKCGWCRFKARKARENAAEKNNGETRPKRRIKTRNNNTTKKYFKKK